MSEITIRNVRIEDAPRLLEIYSPYVKNTAITYEYDVPSLEEFQNRIKIITQKFPYIVAVKNDTVLGYAYAGIFHEREAYKHSCELSIYVDSVQHHKGIGSLLYNELEKQLLAKDITVLYACIAASPRSSDKYLTDASLRFHEARGYKYAGKFTGCAYKFNLWYDMVYMEKHLTKKDSGFEKESEVIDIYDHHRIPKGISINKKINNQPEIKFQTDRYCVIHICIFDGEKMLIQQRPCAKTYLPSLWDFSVEGYVEAGENPENCAARELKKEFNTDYDFSNHPAHFTINFEKGFDDYFIIEKTAECLKPDLQNFQLLNTKWATKEEILQMIKNESFVNYKTGLIELLFDMQKNPGAYN